jgi:hypothetical protein
LAINDGIAIELVRGDSRVAIDARSGEVLAKVVSDADSDVIEAATGTIVVDENVDKSRLPWPYDPTAPTRPKDQEAPGFWYWEPDPAAGIVAGFACGGSASGEGTGCGVAFFNERSSIRVTNAAGRVSVDSIVVAEEDREAFDRLANSVELTTDPQ